MWGSGAHPQELKEERRVVSDYGVVVPGNGYEGGPQSVSAKMSASDVAGAVPRRDAS